MKRHLSAVRARWTTIAIAALSSGVAAAADPPTVRVDLPTIILAEPASEATLSVVVGPAAAIPRQAFVRLRGLPPTVALSDGHAVAPGVWAVPLVALERLKAIIPPNVSGRSELTVALVQIDGEPLAEAKATFVIAPASLASRNAEPRPLASALAPVAKAPPTPTPANDPPPPSAASQPPMAAPATASSDPPPAPIPVPVLVKPPRPALSAEELQRLDQWLAQGDKALASGNVAYARQFYQRVAERGLGLGAFKMAETFDALELEKLPVVGLRPDKVEARKWYALAADLGEARAAPRLRRLDVP